MRLALRAVMHAVATVRAFLPLIVVAAAVVPHAVGCAKRTVPHSDWSLAALEDRAAFAAHARDASSLDAALTGLWNVPGGSSSSGDEPPPLDDCPSLARDVSVTVDGRDVDVWRGGWQERTDGGCDTPTTEYVCTAPSFNAHQRLGSTSTIVLTEGNRSWKVVLGDLPVLTNAELSPGITLAAGDRADVRLTPLPSASTRIDATFGAYDCKWVDTPVAVARTSDGVSFIVPKLDFTRAKGCADEDAGAPDAADAGEAGASPGDAGSADGSSDASSDAALDGGPRDAGDAGDASDATIADDTRPAVLDLVLQFAPHVATCEGPRACTLESERAVTARGETRYR